MSFQSIKTCARAVGLYRVARWAHRHIVDRERLRAFQDEVAFYTELLSPNSLCFDIGANFGVKTEVFLRLGAKVIAFEPQRDCLQELHARLGSPRRLVTVNAAVGSRSGQQTFYIGRERTASSMVKGWQDDVSDSVEVRVTTLDDAIAKFGVPRHCKIDVEGFELEVLKGLSRPIPTLSYEYHLQKDGPARALECLEYLSGLGDILVNVTPAEKTGFAVAHWLGKSDFIDFFRRAVPQLRGYHYGDIFVKFEDADHDRTKTSTSSHIGA